MDKRNLLNAAMLVTVIVMSGRFLGFIRDLVIARSFGASPETDAFILAWTIPETAGPLLLDGAMIFVLVPLFAREIELRGTPKEFVARSLLPVSAALLVMTASVALTAPWIVQILAPGLAAPDLAVQMVRIASVTVFFLGLSGYVRAVLNAHQIFGVPATVYIAYNVGILGSILLLENRIGIYSAAVGLAIGSALMLAIQAPAFFRNTGLPRLSLKLDKGLAYEFAAFIPIGAFVLGRHAQVYVERFLGSLLEPGAISQLNYASKVGQVPMYMAITVAIVSFPAVARAAAGQRMEELRQALERDMRTVSVLILPAIIFLVVFAPEVVELLFQRGAFTAQDAEVTASILRVYPLGLLAQTLVYVAVRAFFTRRNTPWIPLRSAMLGLVVTFLVGFALLRPLGVEGLAAGNAAGISAMMLLMVWDMKRHVVDIHLRKLLLFFVRALTAAVLAGAFAFPLLQVAVFRELSVLLQLVMGGMVIGIAYLIIGRLIGIKELKDLQRRFGIRGARRGV